MKRFAAVALLLILAGCTSMRDYSTLLLYQAEGKVLLFARAPCATASSHSDKPAMVSEWVREKDINKMVVLCDNECNCRLVKRTPNMKMVAVQTEEICQ